MVVRLAAFAAALFFVFAGFPLSQAGAGSLQLSGASRVYKTQLGCSLDSPPKSYSGACGTNLGKNVHLRATSTHPLGSGFALWVSGTRVTPPPAVRTGTTICNVGPCMLDIRIKKGKSINGIVAYDFQARLMDTRSGQARQVGKSNVVRVAWAPAARIVRLTKMETTGTTVHVRMTMTGDDLTPGVEYLDLRIVAGPNRFTSIPCTSGGRGFSAGTGIGAFSPNPCDSYVDCSTFSSGIKVQGRVVNNDDGKVEVTSDELNLCGEVQDCTDPQYECLTITPNTGAVGDWVEVKFHEEDDLDPAVCGVDSCDAFDMVHILFNGTEMTTCSPQTGDARGDINPPTLCQIPAAEQPGVWPICVRDQQATIVEEPQSSPCQDFTLCSSSPSFRLSKAQSQTMPLQQSCPVTPPPSGCTGPSSFSVALSADKTNPAQSEFVHLTATASPDTAGTCYLIKIWDTETKYVYSSGDNPTTATVPFIAGNGTFSGCPNQGNGTCHYQAIVFRRGGDIHNDADIVARSDEVAVSWQGSASAHLAGRDSPALSVIRRTGNRGWR